MKLHKMENCWLLCIKITFWVVKMLFLISRMERIILLEKVPQILGLIMAVLGEDSEPIGLRSVPFHWK